MSEAAEKTTRAARAYAQRLLEAANESGAFSAFGTFGLEHEISRNPVPKARGAGVALAIATALHIKTLILWGGKAGDRTLAAAIAADLMASADVIDAIDSEQIRARRYDLRETG